MQTLCSEYSKCHKKACKELTVATVREQEWGGGGGVRAGLRDNRLINPWNGFKL